MTCRIRDCPDACRLVQITVGDCQARLSERRILEIYLRCFNRLNTAPVDLENNFLYFTDGPFEHVMNLVNKFVEVLLSEWNFILADCLLTGITTGRSVDHLLQPYTLTTRDFFAAIRDDISPPNRTGLSAKVLSTSKVRVTTPAIRGGVGEVLTVAGTARLHGTRDSRTPRAPVCRWLTSTHIAPSQLA